MTFESAALPGVMCLSLGSLLGVLGLLLQSARRDLARQPVRVRVDDHRPGSRRDDC